MFYIILHTLRTNLLDSTRLHALYCTTTILQLTNINLKMIATIKYQDKIYYNGKISKYAL